MSIRVYRGIHRDTGGPSAGFKITPWALFGLGSFFSALWAFFPKDRTDSLTVFLLIFLFIATTAHAFIWWDMYWAATFMVVSLGISFSVLAINSATGFIFGDVQYTYRLGFQILHVPFTAPLIWSSCLYLGIAISRRITRASIMSPLTAALTSTGILIAFDNLFVNAGFQKWLTWIDKPQILGLSSIKSQLFIFLISLIIVILSSQNTKNDRSSFAFPIATFTWVFVFILFAGQILSNNLTSYLIPILLMGYIIVIFVYRTLREN
jgi:uncharacterized membrane protein